MKIKFFCPRWGSNTLSWSKFLNKAKEAGYDGLEIGVARDTTYRELDEIWNKATKLDLDLIVQHYDTCEANFGNHQRRYEEWFKKIEPYSPLFINSQTGKDYFSFEQNLTLWEIAETYSEKHNIPVYHETHRNKFLFAAHIAQRYLDNIPSLKITLDISHWMVVAESDLSDQAEAVELAIERSQHIHARVGHLQSPQISDPRAPEYRDVVELYLQWWDAVVQKRLNEQKELMTITPEFGPHPYLPHLPFTNQPIVDQWEVNAYMMALLRERYHGI